MIKVRNLTRKQKRLLKEEWERLHNEEGIEYPKPKDIPSDTYFKIDNIHPCEIYAWNIHHFFDELNREFMLQSQAFTVYHIDKDGNITTTQEI